MDEWNERDALVAQLSRLRKVLIRHNITPTDVDEKAASLSELMAVCDYDKQRFHLLRGSR